VHLLAHGAPVDAVDMRGRTALMAAASSASRWTVAGALLEGGANANLISHGDGRGPLMDVVSWVSGPRAAAVEALLRHRANPDLPDRFGQAALHLACREGHSDAIKVLCSGGSLVTAQDNDGASPLGLLMSVCAKRDRQCETDELCETVRSIVAASPDAATQLDFGDMSALHLLCLFAGMEKTAPVEVLSLLVAAKSDPLIEEERGWTAVHFAASIGGMVGDALLTSLHIPVDGLALLDLSKPRATSNAKYLLRRGGHHRIPLDERLAVLGGDCSLAGVVRCIAEGRSLRVVALVGAGISTSAGVPDFRSATGLWKDAGTRDLFSLEGFTSEPARFWYKAAELFADRKPTRAHALLAKLSQEGLLQRVYTQNIDGLEMDAGVPHELIVQCHGSATRVVCSADRSHDVPDSVCQTVLSPPVEGLIVPLCTCGALLRPDITFFGEPLPEEFNRLVGADMKECDLLLVMGTGLSVYPVAGLVQQVGPLVPRLLLNREPVGVWRDLPTGVIDGLKPEEVRWYRDAFFEGDCDAGASEFAKVLGWELDQV